VQVHLVIKKADVRLQNYALDAGRTASQMVAPTFETRPSFSDQGGTAMKGRSANPYRKLAVGLLAATGVVGLTARAILAQSNPPGPAASTQDEPIKRTVLFRGDLEGAPGKEIVVFVADLAPAAVGSKHYHPGPEFFYVLEGTLAHEPEGGSPHMMKTGAFGSNPNKGIHLIRNPSTTERARAIDFLIAEKGQPIVIPVK
jgi:quercetin dioxygenase-like cupin family protein